MPNTADFFAPRTCLASHPAEAAVAVELLLNASDAVMAGDLRRAAELLAEANIPVLREFSRNVMDNRDPSVLRLRRVGSAGHVIKKSKDRMPSKGDAFAIFKRDGFRCRYCNTRVILPEARNRLRKAVPDALSTEDKTYHAAFLALNATLDHVVPHARGGDNSQENLVTTCWPCNFGKEAYSLEQLGLTDPRLREPIVDEWDGLSRLLAGTRPPPSCKPAPTAPKAKSVSQLATQGPTSWHVALEAQFPGTARQVLALIEACTPIGVTGAIKKECVIRLTAGQSTIIPVAVTRTGDVEIPWFIGPHKAAFRPFAERIAGSIAGAVVRETSKGWTVEIAGRGKLTVTELLKVQPALISGLMDLRTRLTMGA